MEQSKNNKYKYLLFGAVGCFGLVILVFAAGFFILIVKLDAPYKEKNRQAEEARSKRTAEIVGTVSKRETDVRAGNNSSTSVTSTFYVDGRAYSVTKIFRGAYRGTGVSEQVKVCYDPSKPENAEFYLKDFEQSCG